MTTIVIIEIHDQPISAFQEVQIRLKDGISASRTASEQGHSKLLKDGVAMQSLSYGMHASDTLRPGFALTRPGDVAHCSLVPMQAFPPSSFCK